MKNHCLENRAGQASDQKKGTNKSGGGSASLTGMKCLHSSTLPHLSESQVRGGAHMDQVARPQLTKPCS